MANMMMALCSSAGGDVISRCGMIALAYLPLLGLASVAL